MKFGSSGNHDVRSEREGVRKFRIECSGSYRESYARVERVDIGDCLYVRYSGRTTRVHPFDAASRINVVAF